MRGVRLLFMLLYKSCRSWMLLQAMRMPSMVPATYLAKLFMRSVTIT